MLQWLHPQERNVMVNRRCNSYFPNLTAVLCISTARHGLQAWGNEVLCARQVFGG